MNLARQIRYPIIVEKSPTGYGAYSPDIPGCVAGGSSAEEAIARLQEAVILRIRSKIEVGEPLPEPSSTAWVDIPIV